MATSISNPAETMMFASFRAMCRALTRFSGEELRQLRDIRLEGTIYAWRLETVQDWVKRMHELLDYGPVHPNAVKVKLAMPFDRSTEDGKWVTARQLEQYEVTVTSSQGGYNSKAFITPKWVRDDEEFSALGSDEEAIFTDSEGEEDLDEGNNCHESDEEERPTKRRKC